MCSKYRDHKSIIHGAKKNILLFAKMREKSILFLCFTKAQLDERKKFIFERISRSNKINVKRYMKVMKE